MPRFNASARLTKTQAVELLHGLIKNEVESRGKEMLVTPELLSITNRVVDWLLGKGKRWLLFMGNVGDGKTTMLNAVQKFIISMDIQKPYREGHYSSWWAMYNATAKDLVTDYVKDPALITQYNNVDVLGLDDMGAEPAETMVYGNPVYPIADILMTRYKKDVQTIISTNLKANEIRPRYGDRIADRLNEMCERIVFPEQSYRTL